MMMMMMMMMMMTTMMMMTMMMAAGANLGERVEKPLRLWLGLGDEALHLAHQPRQLFADHHPGVLVLVTVTILVLHLHITRTLDDD
jgi:hypothetical protein